MQNMKDRLCQHYESLGVKSRDASRFASLLSKWQKKSGPEWTVSRMKQLTEALKLNLITGVYNIPEGWATKKTIKGKKIINDGLIHRLLSAKSSKEIWLANSFFTSYKLLMLPQGTVSKKQKRKFDNAVLSDFAGSPEELQTLCKKVSKVPRPIRISIKKFLKEVQLSMIPLIYLGKGNKTSPIITYDYDDDMVMVNSGIMVKRRDNVKTKSLELLTHNEQWNSLWYKYPEEFTQCILGDGNVELTPQEVSPVKLDNDPLIGTVSYIQEPGCKLRSVANPLLVVQALGEPLKVKMDGIASVIPEMFTHDHEAGRQVVQDNLNRGKTCFAYDASSFTDRFPLEFQLAVLSGLRDIGLINQYDMDVFRQGSASTYYDETFQRVIKWKVGQPQGFGPSFAVAAYSHYSLVKTLEKELGLRDDVINFAVIGDDINIFDESLSIAYVKSMTSMGVDINMEKSISSDQLSEMAGKLITKDMIVPSMKLKGGERSAEQLVNLLSFYGPSFWNNLSKDEAPYAMKAILPDYLGGIDFVIPGESRAATRARVNFDRVRDNYLRSEFRDNLGMLNSNSTHAYVKWLAMTRELYSEEMQYAPHRNWRLVASDDFIDSELPNSSDLSHFLYKEENKQVSQLTDNESSSLSLLGQMIEYSMVHDMYHGNPEIPSSERKKLSKIYDLNEMESIAFSSILPLDYIKQFMSADGYPIDEFLKDVKRVVAGKVYSQDNNTPKEANYGQKSKNKPRVSKRDTKSSWKGYIK